MRIINADTKALAVALYLALSSAASADCGAMQPLVFIHDNYRAMLVGQKSVQASAATQISRDFPLNSAVNFVRAFQSLKLEIDIAHLDSILLDGYLLASRVLGGSRIDIVTHAKHKLNVDWLSGELARTGCFREKSIGKRAPSVSLMSAEAYTRALAASFNSRVSKANIDWRMILGAVVAVVAGIGALAIYKSRAARIARVSRMPRETIALPVKVTHTNTQDRIIVLNLSHGGAKVEWEDPPPPGEAFTIELPIGPKAGSIVWSNSFFAGVLFDEHLTLDEFNALIEINGLRTRSQLANVV